MESDIEIDNRLLSKVTFSPSTRRYKDAFHDLGKSSKIRIITQGGAKEFDVASLLIGCRDTTVRGAMDAIASLTLARWQKVDKDIYAFLNSERSLDQVWKAKNEYRRKRDAAGVRFVGSINNLKSALQVRLTAMGGVGFNELTPEMQQGIRDMATTVNQEMQIRTNGKFNPLPSGDLHFSTISLNSFKEDGFNSYHMNVRWPNGRRTTWSFSNYENQSRASRNIGQPRKNDKSIYSPKKMEARDIKRIDELQRIVSINQRNITFPDVLRLLHKAHAIRFVSETKDSMPRRANINLGPISLAQALDRLTEIYPDTEWEYRKYGFIIVRGPNNPARDS